MIKHHAGSRTRSAAMGQVLPNRGDVGARLTAPESCRCSGPDYPPLWAGGRTGPGGCWEDELAERGLREVLVELDSMTPGIQRAGGDAAGPA